MVIILSNRVVQLPWVSICVILYLRREVLLWRLDIYLFCVDTNEYNLNKTL